MGNVLTPRTWCRKKWCREDPSAEHFPGDGCSCDVHVRVQEGAQAHDEGESEPRPILLTTKAARLSAFACRACGANTRRMIEQPAMFFRCEPCAAANRWPMPRAGGD